MWKLRQKNRTKFYCFQCCAFWCDDCITGHNIIRANKEYRVLALTDFQDQDIEDVLKRPQHFVQHLGMGKKNWNWVFCKICEVAKICNACTLTDHEGHAKMLLEVAANERKLQVKSAIESQKKKLQPKRIKIAELKGTVSRTAHVQVISQKWSDVFKFVICETKWRQVNKRGTILTVTEAVETTLAARSFFLIPAAAGNRNGRSREEEFDSSWLQAKLEATYSSTSNSEFAMNLLSLENRRR